MRKIWAAAMVGALISTGASSSELIARYGTWAIETTGYRLHLVGASPSSIGMLFLSCGRDGDGLMIRTKSGTFINETAPVDVSINEKRRHSFMFSRLAGSSDYGVLLSNDKRQFPYLAYFLKEAKTELSLHVQGENYAFDTFDLIPARDHFERLCSEF